MLKNQLSDNFEKVVFLNPDWVTSLMYLMEHNSRTRIISFTKRNLSLLQVSLKKAKINQIFRLISLTSRGNSQAKVIKHLPGYLSFTVQNNRKASKKEEEL